MDILKAYYQLHGKQHTKCDYYTGWVQKKHSCNFRECREKVEDVDEALLQR